MEDKTQNSSKLFEGVKIALVSNTSWSIYNYRVGVIRMFKSQGAKVTVIAPYDAYTSKVVAERVEYVPLKLNNYGTNPFQDLRLFVQLLRLYKRLQFDFIYHYTLKPNIYGSVAARIAGIPNVAVTTGLGKLFSFKSGLINRLVNTLFKLGASSCSEMWFLNQSDLKRVSEKGLCQSGRSFVLPSEGINLTKFVPYNNSDSSTSFRFLFAGRLLADKGIREYVKAAQATKSLFPKIKFEVLGFIDEKNPSSISHREIREWQHSDFINYLGSAEDVRPYIARAFCVVFPSYYQEGIPRILLEAAAMEKPVITTSIVGCEDVVINGYNGYLCSPGSVNELVDAIRTMLTLDPMERKLMGKAGRKHVRKFFDERIVIHHYKQRTRALLPSHHKLAPTPKS